MFLPGPNCRVGNISCGKDHVVSSIICRCTLRGSVAECRPYGCMHNGMEPFRHSACEDCQGHFGLISCAIADCFFSPCVDAVHKPDVCCPVCSNGPNCYHGNTKIPTRKEYNDGQQICRCPDNSHVFGPGGQQAACRVVLDLTTAPAHI